MKNKSLICRRTGNVENLDNDLKILFDIARKFDNPYEFDDYLNRNKLGHNSDYSFIGERFRRLHRGTRLSGNDKIEIFRTGDEPIKWGDYIYLDYNDAKRAYDAGQGNKIYKKVVPKSDVIETSISGEYYYSPKKIANIGKDLIDLWNYVNGIVKNDAERAEFLKDETATSSPNSTKEKEVLVAGLRFKALSFDGQTIEMSIYEIGTKYIEDDVFYYNNGTNEPVACQLSSLVVVLP